MYALSWGTYQLLSSCKDSARIPWKSITDILELPQKRLRFVLWEICSYCYSQLYKKYSQQTSMRKKSFCFHWRQRNSCRRRKNILQVAIENDIHIPHFATTKIWKWRQIVVHVLFLEDSKRIETSCTVCPQRKGFSTRLRQRSNVSAKKYGAFSHRIESSAQNVKGSNVKRQMKLTNIIFPEITMFAEK